MKNIFTLVMMMISFKCLSQTYSRTVQLHLFEWPWEDIAKECEQYLGPNGFAAVQVSPPQDHAILPGRPWYERYQPVSYQLISRSGDKKSFINMVQRCKQAGVDIYVDAVINHMTWIPQNSAILNSIGGNQYTYYQYPNYRYNDFHHFNFNGDGSIANYNDRFEVQNGNLALCADLNTASPYVQNTIANYLNELLSMGVTGFRIDAAKHIPKQDLQQIFSRLAHPPYIYQEVIDYGDGPIRANEYLPNGDVLNFKYSKIISNAFLYHQTATLIDNLKNTMDIPSDKAVVFVDNHDLERSEQHINYKNAKAYYLANVFMLAFPCGYPQVLSGYHFNNYHEGPPTDNQGYTLSPYQRPERWVLFHRKVEILNMVQFRNRTNSYFALTNPWSGADGQISFGRGPLGHVVINPSNKGFRANIQTSMRPGIYNDLLRQGKVVVIDPLGKINISLEPFEAMAILTK
ncbi:MAG TPA: alpha-amylase family protein [Bacteriovoracaceae bacterium]|nr:alpha-amylase family protein [Bacteriovoracaceae bacterium]